MEGFDFYDCGVFYEQQKNVIPFTTMVFLSTNILYIYFLVISHLLGKNY